MPRRSSIKGLPTPVKAAIDAAIKADRLSLDDILGLIHAQYGEHAAPSRSALGRYRKSVEEQMAAVRETREVADVWATRLGEAPESDIGKVVLEILRTLAYRSGADLLEGGEVAVGDIAKLSRAMQYIEDAGRMSVAREQAVREAALAEAEANIDKLAGGKGNKRPDAETLALVRAAIRGDK